MARKIDPDNLSFLDVILVLAGAFGPFVAIFIVAVYVPSFLWLAILGAVGWIVYTTVSMPRDDKEALAEVDRRVDARIHGLPFVGPFALRLKRIADWLIAILLVGSLIVLIYSLL